ncbi:hypothetical protein [Nocardia cyriacigeorgica]|uniref:hypothetical protein n=1 Tax=Nocardia cyriacigeorgica TaxID=135487 RepID=UPI0020177E1B|nr:hypothetical protein [Nocardia cyriacigeorgica]
MTTHHTASSEPSVHAIPRQHGDTPSNAVDWGQYTQAIRWWETALGRPAPHPTQPGLRGSTVLAPAFVEWLMGLPEGWVTGLDLPRIAQLRALGNGVVPQQAAYAIGMLRADFEQPTASRHRKQRQACRGMTSIPWEVILALSGRSYAASTGPGEW